MPGPPPQDTSTDAPAGARSLGSEEQTDKALPAYRPEPTPPPPPPPPPRPAYASSPTPAYTPDPGTVPVRRPHPTAPSGQVSADWEGPPSDEAPEGDGLESERLEGAARDDHAPFAEVGEPTDPLAAPLDESDQALPDDVSGEASYALEVVAGPGFGQQVPIGSRPTVVGRSLGALRVDDPFVSEGHASFSVHHGEVVVADGGSPSGVFVEVGRRVALAQGDVFACGLQVFRFLGEVEQVADPSVYGAPLPPFKAYRLEHILVGGRSGRVLLFRHSASVGRTRGSLQFPDDELLEELHVELKAGPHGMALLTHAQHWPTFMRIPGGTEVVLATGTLVRMGTCSLRVLGPSPGP